MKFYLFRCVNVLAEQSKIDCDKIMLENFPEYSTHLKNISKEYIVGVKPKEWENPCILCPCKCDNSDSDSDSDSGKKKSSGCPCEFINA